MRWTDKPRSANAGSQIVIQTITDNQTRNRQNSSAARPAAGIPAAVYIAVPVIIIASAAVIYYLRVVKKRKAS